MGSGGSGVVVRGNGGDGGGVVVRGGCRGGVEVRADTSIAGRLMIKSL